ncbi:histidine kinase [Streptomyces sp. NPDC047002]|uniref:sensor histidine kinase n=1 Tax=Streptomyces sp. NPDC047002 TaxID=3155475 RepID=UPI003452C55C
MDTSRGLARQGPLAAEIGALVLAAVADALLTTRLTAPPTGGWRQPLVALLPSVGPAIGLLALVRRRFPERLARLAAWAAGASLASTALLAAADRSFASGHRSCACEVVALALFAGAAARRLPAGPCAALVTACGTAAGLAAFADPGGDAGRPAAAGAAVLWAAAAGIGLLLRDADRRRDTDLAGAVAAQRAALARDLHDVVAHHVTGIVVLAKAARLSARDAGADEGQSKPDVSGYAQIEGAGAEALRAMRQLVGLLKTEPAPGTLRDAVAAPARTEPRARLLLDQDLDAGPEETRPVAAVVRRVTVEALTNVRRHAPGATEVTLTARVVRSRGRAVLRLDIANDGVADEAVADGAVADDGARGPGRGGDFGHTGHGLSGMAERVAAFGGSCTAGPRDGGRWRVEVRIPLAPPREGPLFPTGPRGRP